MPIPFIDLKRLVTRVRSDVLNAWTECLDNCEFVGGPRVQNLETKLQGLIGAPHVVTCANGTDALVLALHALGIERGMRVALPNLTFWATFEAVAQLGAIPVLVDIDPDDLQISFDQLRSAHDAHRLNAVMLVHLFGWTSARLGEIRAWCKENAIAVVEDGAQAFGVEAAGKPLLSGAEAATLSFYPAKVVGGAMDGGAVTLQNGNHAARVRSLGNHGRADHYSYAHVGYNSRMGGLQAAFLNRILDELPLILESRRESAQWYRERLTSEPAVRGKLRVFGPPEGITENGYLNVVTLASKRGADVAESLKAAGIATARTYPETMDAQPPAKACGAIAHGDLRHSKRFCEHVINLPLFFGMQAHEREASVRALIETL